MTFLAMVVRNLLRQRVRTLLTVVGITLGIATVVALGSITAGLKGTADSFVTSGGASFVVAQQGAADLSFSRIDQELLPQVAGVAGVADVRGMLLEITQVGTNPFFFLGGVELARIESQQLDLVAGRLPTTGEEVVLGTDAAADLGVTAGDSVELVKRTFTVVGVFDSEVVWERGGGFTELATVQEMTKKSGVVTLGFVTLEPGADPDRVAAAIESAVPDLVTIADSTEYGQVDQGFTLIDAANTAISLLAVVIGGVGVMNTMVMAIFERTREIGILRAVGWKAGRVLRMVLLESLVLCVIAAVLGSLLGIGLTALVTQVPSVREFVVPAYPLAVFTKALLVAVLVAVLGAIYPALRATRLTPMEALRYE